MNFSDYLDLEHIRLIDSATKKKIFSHIVRNGMPVYNRLTPMS